MSVLSPGTTLILNLIDAIYSQRREMVTQSSKGEAQNGISLWCDLQIKTKTDHSPLTAENIKSEK